MGASAKQRDVALEHERRAWELRQQLWTHERIAKELGVDRSTVTKALQRVAKRMVRDLTDRQMELTAEQVAQLQHIADEAMQAWNSSKQPVKDAKRSRHTGKGDTEESRVQSQNADPRYLVAAMGALEDIRKLMKLETVSLQHSGEVTVTLRDMEKKGRERWQNAAPTLAQALGAAIMDDDEPVEEDADAESGDA